MTPNDLREIMLSRLEHEFPEHMLTKCIHSSDGKMIPVAMMCKNDEWFLVLDFLSSGIEYKASTYIDDRTTLAAIDKPHGEISYSDPNMFDKIKAIVRNGQKSTK